MGPSETPDSVSQGRCLAGRYRLTEVIGSGGAGNVWAAVDEVLQRRVAVKDVGAPPWLSVEGWQALRERTLREARASAAISHPNVVAVYDVVEEDDRPWIVMQLVEARTLSQIIDEDGPCPPRRTAEIGLQVLAALRAAHAHGILHRDVKPSNVLVCDDGRAVLTDFGIAMVDGDTALTASGVLVGAPAYIAPERVHGGVAGPASDLWSLGATLYTAVEGNPPYRRDSPISTIAAVVNDDPDPISRAGVLEPLLDALLRRDPGQRPTAAQVELILHRIVSTGSPVLDAELTTVLAAPAAAATRQTPAYGESGGSGGTGGSDGSSGLGELEQRRLRALALLTAAAVALMAIVLTGYLARHTLEPGFPSQRPGNNEPAGPEPVADLHPSSSGPAAGGQRRAPGASVTSTTGTPATDATPAGTQQPTLSQPPADATPTSRPEPPSATTDPTTTGPEPSPGGVTTSVAALP